MFRHCVILAWATVVCGLAQAQYVPVRVIGVGQPAPGSGSNISFIFGNHCVSSTGEVAVYINDDSPSGTDQSYWINGVDTFRAGFTPLGGATAIDTCRPMSTYSQYNDTDLAWEANDVTGNNLLMLNDTALILEGTAALGIPGRVFQAFDEPCLTTDGGIYFCADLNGSSADNAIYYLPPGGNPAPVSTPGGSIFWEGQPIQGGPLDGMQFNSNFAFGDLECNLAGTLILGASLSGGTDVVILKPLGAPYQAPLLGGDFLMIPGGGTAPVDQVVQVAIARGNENWAAHARLSQSSVGPLADDVVVVDIGSGPQVVFQEGDDISTLTGPGTTLGPFIEVNINSNGKVVLIALVAGGGSSGPEAAIFLWDAGTTSLVLTEGAEIPALHDDLDLLQDDIVINDQDRIFFQCRPGFLDTVFEAVLPSVAPVRNLACQVTGNQITANWDLGQNYTGIRVFVDGLQQVPDLPGTATSYATSPLTSSTSIELKIVGLVGADEAPEAVCNTSFILPPDFEACLDFVPFVTVAGSGSTSTDVVTFPQNVLIGDASIEVQIDHSTILISSIRPLEVTSPEGTTVRLHGGSGFDEGLRAIYSDLGRPNGVPFDASDLMQVQGPGQTSDWRCENAAGDWTFFLMYATNFASATLERYCVRINEETLPSVDCCNKPSAPLCVSSGSCGVNGITITWDLNDPLFGLELIRDDGSAVTTIPLAATDTSFVDTNVVFGTTYNYKLNYACSASSEIRLAGECTVLHDAMLTPGVTDLACTNDFCLGEVEVSWNTNGINYDMITLNRGGVFLADVTGMNSFVDTGLPSGLTTYSVVVDCSGSTTQTDCEVEISLPPPTNLTCTANPALCDGMLTLSWDNSASYTALDLLRNGVLVSPGVAPGDVSFVDGPLTPGIYVYELLASCNGSSAVVACTTAASVAPTGTETDLILALESPSGVDSVTALQKALVAAGRQVYVAFPDPDILNLRCGVDPTTFANVWSMGGTFPNDYRHSVAELDFLASLSDIGVGIYFESADHWGFQHVDSNLDELDGIEQDTVLDGDQTFTSMDGLNSGLGLSLSVEFSGSPGPDSTQGTLDDVPGALYLPDQLDTGSTDRFLVTGTSPGVPLDAEVLAAGAIWRNNVDSPEDFNEYITGVFAISAMSRMISTSWEFGGFNLDPQNPTASDADRQLLAELYLEALAGAAQPRGRFIRGDTNRSGAVDIADGIYLLGHLFPGTGTPNLLLCLDAADVNGDGQIDLGDAIFVLGTLFSNVLPPPPNIFTGCGEAPVLGCLANTPGC